MSEEKGMYRLYEVKQAVHMGKTEIVQAEDTEKLVPHDVEYDAEKIIAIENTSIGKETKYLLAERTYNNAFGMVEYKNATVSNDYLEVMEEFTKRIQGNIKELQQERAKFNIDITALGYDYCIPKSELGDYEGKVCIVKSSSLYPEYRTPMYQLVYITHGNGARADAIGRACYNTELYSGEKSRRERIDILGVADPKKLPAWAKEKLSEIKRQEKKRESKER